jgi:sugar-specific transcriptional regulator TrmB
VNEAWVQQLITLGLNKYEARAYLALLGHDESSAVEVANRARIPRQRIYDVLASLRDWGMVVTRDGRPVRYSAKDPAIALPYLLEIHRRQYQAQHERQIATVNAILTEMGPLSNESIADSTSSQEIQAEDQRLSGGF